VSNIQGKDATGSMVTFINGKADKNFYRRFKIRFSNKPDDTAMLKQALLRRFNHPEWGLPDLILIDGGKAQLNTTLSITKIPAIALAKRRNELYMKNLKKPILLKDLPREVFNLILQLRDEAHRFARKYHHKLREISTFD
jgi:excinuclease ABC subunit C